MPRLPAVALALTFVLSACAPDTPDAQAPPRATGTVDPKALQVAQSACMAGDATRGIAELDSVAAAAGSDDVDLLTTRGICYWTRFAADSSHADAEAAYRDLTDAIAAVQRLPADHGKTPLDRLYNHRAFIVQAVRPGDWAATVADLQAARQANPRALVHTRDLGVAHAMARDTVRAIATLRVYLDSARADDASRPVAERMLADLGADPARR